MCAPKALQGGNLVVPIDAHPRHAWLLGAVNKRLRDEFAKLRAEINGEKSRTVELDRGASFAFLGFDPSNRSVADRRISPRGTEAPETRCIAAAFGGGFLDILHAQGLRG